VEWNIRIKLEAYYVETTVMLKAVKKLNYNKKKHCNIRVDVKRFLFIMP